MISLQVNYIIGGVIAALLLVYLIYSLLKPEKF
jgi:K+-transporting ATPase KdpF subunit